MRPTRREPATAYDLAVILLIDNYDSFTWNLVQRLGELDPSLEPDRDLMVVRNDKITPEEARTLDRGGPSHIIISPGPCTPDEAGVSRDIIRAFGGETPILGVCLGHQCMADVGEMNVGRHDHPQHGKTAQIHHDGAGLFQGLPNPFTATRYHSLVVEASSVPEGADEHGDRWHVGAWCFDPPADGQTEDRKIVMGLRRQWGDASRQPLEGVQFHPESFMTVWGHRLLANFLAMGPRGREIDAARVDELVRSAEIQARGAEPPAEPAAAS